MQGDRWPEKQPEGDVRGVGAHSADFSVIPRHSKPGEGVGSGARASQVGGSHYTDMPIQPVEYIHRNGLGFMEGCVVKYVSRHRAKNKAEDIRKAIHFCKLILSLEYGEDA